MVPQYTAGSNSFLAIYIPDRLSRPIRVDTFLYMLTLIDVNLHVCYMEVLLGQHARLGYVHASCVFYMVNVCTCGLLSYNEQMFKCRSVALNVFMPNEYCLVYMCKSHSVL